MSHFSGKVGVGVFKEVLLSWGSQFQAFTSGAVPSHQTEIQRRKMKSAFIWILVLACASVCLTAPAILDCRCLTLNKNVRFAQIDDVLELDPRPYCSRKEVIVKLKDGTSRCLDPKEKFTEAVVLTKRLQVLRNNMKKNLSLRSTMAPATATAQSSTLKSR